MKNLALTPVARAQTMHKVLQSSRDEGEWVKTSVSLRKHTRQAVKTYAATHDMTIQQVIEEALTEYLQSHA